MKALVNGVSAEALSLLDRGLHYGDGVFETMVYRRGHLVLWSRHYHRLQQGCERLGIVAPTADALLQDIAALVDSDCACVIKILVTRGAGGRGYNAEGANTPQRIVMLYPDMNYPSVYAEEGIWARVCSTRLAVQPKLAGIKHLNRLEYVLARAEWRDADIVEGVLLDTQDRVVEGISTNLFGVWQGRLATPALDGCGVAGTLRAAMLEYLAKRGVACDVRTITQAELAVAQELFLCNSVAGIWPVRKLGEQEYAVGAQTRWLQSQLDEIWAEA
jgi:4-amino-4-deoxychorismate lyase